MSGLLLANYDASMRIGQGYNSFLQIPCMNNAVRGTSEILETFDTTPQTVSYSTRLVTKISDVVRLMNISVGSSIKDGSIKAPGGLMCIDELKFAESDLNLVISIKVNLLDLVSANIGYFLIKGCEAKGIF
jgi:hypothetical protein